MSFQFETGTATDVADWFTIFEAFMLAAGWTVEAGSGTQEITFRSIGEAGGRAKLYIRFRQDAVNGERVWYRVQDDLAGTHFTTEDAFTENLDAGGGGAALFGYWMAANRNYVTVTFLSAAYTGCYVGIVERFALAVGDEEYEMVAYPLHTMDSIPRNGRVLRSDDGIWDHITKHREVTNFYDRHPIDQSYCLFGQYVYLGVLATDHDRIIGELIGVSARLNHQSGGPDPGYVRGLCPQDTITSRIGGATSWWTVLGTGTVRWAMFCGGTLPSGTWEGGFAHTQGTANSVLLLRDALDAFLTGLGWTITPNGSVWPTLFDQYYRSTGQLGTEDIWIEFSYRTDVLTLEFVLWDPTLTHWTGWPNIDLVGGDFPVNYHFGGDKDCFYVAFWIGGEWAWVWCGLFKPLWADNASYVTGYNLGIISQDVIPCSPTARILRAPDGNWSRGLSAYPDEHWYRDSSPQQMDGVTYMVWPQAYNYINSPVGIPKYIHRASGVPLFVNDTITVGAKVYTVIGTVGATYREWCIRTA